MDIATPYVGTLLIPDKILPGDSPVQQADGELVAQIRRPVFALRNAFDILDPTGAVVAHGSTKGFFRQRYVVTTIDLAPLLELTLSWSGTSGRSRVALSDGREAEVKGNWWTERRYTLVADGREVASVSPTSSSFSMRADSYAFELREPVLSIVQAVGLAQCLRAAVKAARSARASQTQHHHR